LNINSIKSTFNPQQLHKSLGVITVDLNLKGRKAIVTGGSRGIGQATLKNLINEGASIATCARGDKALQETLSQFRAQGATAFGRAVDVSNKSAFTSWFNEAVEQLGGLDILVSNVTSYVDTQNLERWADMFENDLLQHIRTTELALPHLERGNNSNIVYIASIASVMTNNMKTEVEYGTMKAALVSYACQLANRLGKKNIRVNVVSPGPIQHPNGFWEMIERKDPKLHKAAASLSVFNRLGKASEVANAVTFLTSPAASLITGANLRVDGGTIKTVNF